MGFFQDIGHSFSNAGGSIVHTFSNAGNSITKGVSSVGHTFSSGGNSVVKGFKSFGKSVWYSSHQFSVMNYAYRFSRIYPYMEAERIFIYQFSPYRIIPEPML